MMPELHPWLSTREAVEAARKAVQIPLALLPEMSARIGRDELESEAFAILTECALPPRCDPAETCSREGCTNSLANVRKGAKFCSQKCRRHQSMDVARSKNGERPRGRTATVLPAATAVHVGSMHTWPEDRRDRYAIRVVGYALNNWIRTHYRVREVPSSDSLANLNVPLPEADQSAYEFVTDFLESRGVKVMGDESFNELAEAALHVRGETKGSENLKAAA